MIKRFVRLAFKPQYTSAFEAIFLESKHQIKGFTGCLHLELGRDINDPRIYYTISIWEDETSLEAYRSSTLFQETWARTKALFDERPLAFSLQTMETL